MKMAVSESSLSGPRTRTRSLLVIASPLVIVALGALAAQLSVRLFGQWAWAGTMPVYWGGMALVIAAFSSRERLAALFGPSRGSRLWPVLALLLGLSAFPLLLLPNLQLLRSPLLALLWAAFALVNGVIEEAYWRGFLFREIRGLPVWLIVLYSSVLFIAIHFLMLGAFAPALFNLPFFVILTVITLVYAVMFLRTGSLRWPVFSHVLTDLGNMNIFVFMSLVHFL